MAKVPEVNNIQRHPVDKHCRFRHLTSKTAGSETPGMLDPKSSRRLIAVSRVQISQLIFTLILFLFLLARMRQTTTQAVVMDQLEEPEATILALLLSSLKRSPNALSEGLLLKKLCQVGKHTQTEAAFMFGRSVSWVTSAWLWQSGWPQVLWTWSGRGSYAPILPRKSPGCPVMCSKPLLTRS